MGTPAAICAGTQGGCRRRVLHPREGDHQRRRHKKGRRIDSDQQLRGREVEDQRTDCGGDQYAGRVQSRERTLDASEPHRPGHARNHGRVGGLCGGVQELRQRNHHEDGPDQPRLRKHDDRGGEHALHDGAGSSDTRRPVAVGKRTTREWSDQTWRHPGQHVDGGTDRGVGQAEEQDDECHRREPVTVKGDTRSGQQPNRRTQRASGRTQSACGRVRRSFQRRFLSWSSRSHGKRTSSRPNPGPNAPHCAPGTRHMGPLRDNDAIDPLSGRHEITQWFVTDVPYSGGTANPSSRCRPK